MAKSQNLASMSVDALLKLRDDITNVLGRKATELKHQLSLLGGSPEPKRRGRPAGKTGTRKGPAKGSKVAPKYRNPENPKETWTGRGKQPRWLAAYTAQGRDAAEFLIPGAAAPTPAKAAKGARKRVVKKARAK